MSYEQSRKLINRLTIISTIVIIGLCIYWYQLGIFTSQAKMSAYLADKKILGPIIFVLIQIIQVVIPIIPGGVSLLAGVVFFGTGPGFIYNYIGIVIGSLINFFLARYYGKSFILHIVSEESLEKYTKWTKNQKKFNWFFAICILAPVAPDDLLCLLAGLTEMKPWTYFWIIVLCKPWTIAAYSLGLVYGARWIMRLM
ncbi:TVP38/TMEM64 family protein [Lactobacillus delbrueckii]|uniref:TVP38/TMEM64 family protein n=1 Tax=Lactobacillus delbrueckii TaxID=1584 RepID=UPI0021A6229F|nr:VTT domain-containing protein [Lactobacillus delbrueckii]MCT2878896.1 TVP38/TMEM64 family protein [Lactobacillus delbrueckii]MCT3491514.1 TVP38/TMEM64 family protein [Lactobacillus delbrueckii]